MNTFILEEAIFDDLIKLGEMNRQRWDNLQKWKEVKKPSVRNSEWVQKQEAEIQQTAKYLRQVNTRFNTVLKEVAIRQVRFDNELNRLNLRPLEWEPNQYPPNHIRTGYSKSEIDYPSYY